MGDKLMAVDVGNTNIAFGIFENGKLENRFRLTTNINVTADEIGMRIIEFFNFHGFKAQDIEDVIISSVVPPIMFSLEHAIEKYINIKPMVVGAGIKTGINVRIDNPKELGADRIVNAVSGYHKYGGPLIIIDFGTATTFCAIDINGDYLGGVICPGIKISLEALFERAAKLQRIEIAKPDKVIGKNTIKSMQSGAVFGYAGQVDVLVERIKSEMGYDDVKVIATGGMAWMLQSVSRVIEIIDKNLTLDGLHIIYNKNKR